MKRTLSLLSIAIALGVASAAPVTAKPPRQQPPTIEVLTPTVSCSLDGNDVTVDVQVITDGTMQALSMSVARWEEIATPPFHVAGQLERVEHFIAELPAFGGNAPKVPAGHLLATSDTATWRVRLYLDPATYLDTSSLWGIGVQAWAAEKKSSVEDSFNGTYDCSIPDWVNHTYPPEMIEYGDL